MIFITCLSQNSLLALKSQVLPLLCILTESGVNEKKDKNMDEPPPYAPSVPSVVTQPLIGTTTYHTPSADSTENLTPSPPVDVEAVVAQPVATHTVVGTQVVAQPFLGKTPAQIVCRNCMRSVVTSTSSDLTSEGCILCIVLCCLGGLFCFWIPFVMDSMYTTTHRCPNCNNVQGVYRH